MAFSEIARSAPRGVRASPRSLTARGRECSRDHVAPRTSRPDPGSARQRGAVFDRRRSTTRGSPRLLISSNGKKSLDSPDPILVLSVLSRLDHHLSTPS